MKCTKVRFSRDVHWFDSPEQHPPLGREVVVGEIVADKSTAIVVDAAVGVVLLMRVGSDLKRIYPFSVVSSYDMEPDGSEVGGLIQVPQMRAPQ